MRGNLSAGAGGPYWGGKYLKPAPVPAPLGAMPSLFLRSTWAQVVAGALLASLLLTLRFAPDWMAVGRGVGEIRAATGASGAALERIVLGGYSARGWQVLEQARNLGVEVDDPGHRIVRWRLLPPAVGRILHLPGWLTLGLAHAGAWVLVGCLVWLGLSAGRRWAEAVALGVVGGATAPFFTAMGLPGYYDSWLALALLAPAFARRRGWVLLACLLGPWIDERFVLGLPLALLVRRVREGEAAGPWGSWLRREALAPLALVAGYAGLRLGLGGTGGSQTVGGYLRHFVLAVDLGPAAYLRGAWEGLRFAWLPVAATVLLAGGFGVRGPLLPALAAAATAMVGLLTALDLSRSMVLLLPLVPLGWNSAARTSWWNGYRLPALLAVAALAVPASHVVGGSARPVDAVWSVPTPWLDACNGTGIALATGVGVARDPAAAARWYARAAECGHAAAQLNLAALHRSGEGLPRDPVRAAGWCRRAADAGEAGAQYLLAILHETGEGVALDRAAAVHWYRRAAAQGYAPAQSNLGAALLAGEGVERDPAAARRWFQRAAAQDQAVAQFNLGVVLLEGLGGPRDPATAAHWYRRAARQGHPQACLQLGLLLAAGHGVPRDPVEAVVWVRRAVALGAAGAQEQLGRVEAGLTPEQRQAAEARAAEQARR